MSVKRVKTFKKMDTSFRASDFSGLDKVLCQGFDMSVSMSPVLLDPFVRVDEDSPLFFHPIEVFKRHLYEMVQAQLRVVQSVSNLKLHPFLCSGDRSRLQLGSILREYPFQQLIFCNMDSVTARIFHPLIEQYANQYSVFEWDIIHQISIKFDEYLGSLSIESTKYSELMEMLREASKIYKYYQDLLKLMFTLTPIVETCWSPEYTASLMKDYYALRGWKQDLFVPVRIYTLCSGSLYPLHSK